MKAFAGEGRFAGEPSCPRCDRVIDGFTAIRDGAIPKSGDVTVCLYCSAVLEIRIAENGSVGLAEAPAELVAEVTLELSRIQAVAGIIRDIKSAKKG